MVRDSLRRRVGAQKQGGQEGQVCAKFRALGYHFDFCRPYHMWRQLCRSRAATTELEYVNVKAFTLFLPYQHAAPRLVV